MRLLHINGQAISRYTKNELRDLINYLEPDISITSNNFGGTGRIFDQVNQYETIRLDDVEGNSVRNFSEESLFVIKDVEKLSNTNLNNLSSETNVVTNQIKEETDFSTFETKILDNELIKELEKRINNFKIFTTKLEASEERKLNQRKIYGIAPQMNQYGKIKLPLIKTQKIPNILLFPSEKVGIKAITDIGQKFTSKLKREGIKTRKDLCKLKPKEIMKYEGIGPYRGTKWITSAMSTENQKIYKIKQNNLKNKDKIFIDIETDSLRPNIIWHIGIYNNKKEEYKNFLEKNPKKKKRIIKKFIKYLEKHKTPKTVLLAWYGKKFDYKILKKFIKEYAPNYLATWKQIDKKDFMEWIKKHTATPCRTQKLEHMSEKTNFKTEKTGLNGEKVGKMYTEYMNNQKEDLNWKKLEKYGKNDVMAMKHIYEKIKEAPMPYNIKNVKQKYNKSQK